MKFTKSVQTSDLKLFGSLEEAQQHEIELILEATLTKPIDQSLVIGDAAKAILENREKLIDILSTTSRSRPSRRRINGAVRKSKAAAEGAV